MRNLLNMVAAIALLVWATHFVRTAVLQLLGARLSGLLRSTLRSRATAALSGVAVTALLQSSNATALMVSGFVGQGVVSLPAALAVMRGADIGTALISVLFSADLSWMSPLFISIGVALFTTSPEDTKGRIGKGLIGLGLLLLSLRLLVAAAEPLFEGPLLRTLIASLSGGILLQITLGAVLAVLAYSSLAIVLLVAAMAASQFVALEVALGFVLGANVGSGVLALLTTAKSTVAVKQVTLGNLILKALGVAMAAPFVAPTALFARQYVADPSSLVVLYHLAFNITASVILIGLNEKVARAAIGMLPEPLAPAAMNRLCHLETSALSTPSLAISNSKREALYQAELVETMLNSALIIIQRDDLRLAQELRDVEARVDELHSNIKDYLTRIARESLSEEEEQRWDAIFGFTIIIEQIADRIERVILDIEAKKIRPQKRFSEAGMAEIVELHEQLVTNLRLGTCVFLNGNARDAQRLLQAKARFLHLERRYSNAHLDRLMKRTPQSVETSALHIDLIRDFRTINSQICEIAYVVHGSAVNGYG